MFWKGPSHTVIIVFHITFSLPTVQIRQM